ncbi:MAG TPA: DUF1786 domain-containing protein [Ktedonobacterales bacterium]|nr:DUF1786 domain-containing protein [Ktedonobacterales bacterium]
MGERVRVLAVDVGTGTQDILLFESDRTIENCFQMILPSPTVIVAERITRATAAGVPVLLTGHTMGGGPCAWAARDHAQAGFPCYATPDAARTLDDDLAAVEAQGLRIVESDEARRLIETEGDRLAHIEMRDFDAAAIKTAFTAFGVDPTVDAIAVAAFDHGAAPPGYSDRRFRFDYIENAVRQRPDPLAFAYRAADLPADLTRLAAVAADASVYSGDGAADAPVFVMDTGAAAVAGALEDPSVRRHHECLVANVGNFHTLAFSLRDGQILALFEHHTGLLDQPKLEVYLVQLADGTLENEAIFADSGHGALRLDTPTRTWTDDLPFLAVTGPRRELLRGSRLHPYEAVPHGDMMLAGCFGLLRGVAALDSALAPHVERVLGPGA